MPPAQVHPIHGYLVQGATKWPVCVACLPQYAQLAEKHLLFKSAPSLTLKTLVAQEKSCAVPSLSFFVWRLDTLWFEWCDLRHHSPLNLHCDITASTPSTCTTCTNPTWPSGVNSGSALWVAEYYISCHIAPSSYQGQIRHTSIGEMSVLSNIAASNNNHKHFQIFEYKLSCPNMQCIGPVVKLSSQQISPFKNFQATICAVGVF